MYLRRENKQVTKILKLTGQAEITTIVFSPNGEYLASGSFDKTINI